MLLEPNKARDIVLTTIYLHNFLRKSRKSRNVYAPGGTFDCELSDGTLVEGAWQREVDQTSVCSLKKVPRKSPSNAQAIREEMAEYFITNGRTAWKDDRA
jgi:hypothetical protein